MKQIPKIEAYSATPNISLTTKEPSFEQNSGSWQKFQDINLNVNSRRNHKLNRNGQFISTRPQNKETTVGYKKNSAS